MSNSIIEKFKKIGAEARIVYPADTRRVKRGGWGGSPVWYENIPVSVAPFSIDIKTEKGKEIFEIIISPDNKDALDLQVLECNPEERHLVLFAKQNTWTNRPNAATKMHFLCGHDERHFFVAGVSPCSTVREAKNLLKPLAVRQREEKIGLRNSKTNKRHNEAFVRQGEWFFVPCPEIGNTRGIRKDEPITRSGGGKPHTAQFAQRTGGRKVYTNNKGITVLDERTFKAMKTEDQVGYTQMMVDPVLYVKGTVRHLDHATIDLGDVWHRVYMNTENHSVRGKTVRFLD